MKFLITIIASLFAINSFSNDAVVVKKYKKCLNMASSMSKDTVTCNLLFIEDNYLGDTCEVVTEKTTDLEMKILAFNQKKYDACIQLE